MKTNQLKFLQRLKRLPRDRGKVETTKVYKLFIEIYHNIYSQSEYDQKFIDFLIDLEIQGKLILQTRKKWDNTMVIPRPNWIRIPSNKKISHSNNWKQAIWVPQLEWILKLRVKSEKTYHDLWIINEWLKNKTITELLPEKERSVQLFGDEKKLRELFSKYSFHCDLFSLVESYKTHEPLTFRMYETTNQNGIILENRDTFDSFCRITQNQKDPYYKFIIYGNGLSILENYDDIVSFEEKLIKIDYFGDLDPTGLFIGQELQKKGILLGLMINITFTPFYERLIKCYQAQTWTFPYDRQSNPYNLEFFPSVERNLIQNLFDQNLRIPQELLNKTEIRMILNKLNNLKFKAC